ncbi:PQQ-dependent sugar dehydrogenase [Synechococcus sp. SynAce01]|uniref:PQQ-dependent sugar dehydrogenase n=2 Tax=unclassified Synechococcus TaxID=2626047 RepID=UPI000A477570|nr:PQQ-dependent sugar dehydrogenase [Synechococcus sp. SynAce01]TWB93250.1 glucose/arabinose dehydrogenase [Synechococcus sp. Ace-Pa]
MVMSTGPTAGPLEHQVLLNIKLLKPAPLSLLLAMLLLPAAGCAAAEEARQAPSPTPPLHGGGGLGTTVRPKALVTGLEHPWGMAWLPDGSVLITERPGRLRLVRDGVLDPRPISGVPEVLAQGQGGLLDVAVDPDFERNRFIYLSYAAGERGANGTRVARARFNGQSLSDLEVIYAVPQNKPGAQHFGSRLLWLPDGSLLVSIGDGGNPPLQLEGALIRRQAQNRSSALGKLLRITRDGAPARGNPFATGQGEAPKVWSYGHRNVQGLALDPLNGRVWVSEHGARGGDELNLVEAGANYGWPVVTHSREYSGPPISAAQSAPGLVDPRRVWTPAIAPSGLAIDRGDRYPGWSGNLFAGGLVSRDVRRISLQADGTVASEETIPIGARVRDVRQGPDGYLYVLTDSPDDGQLLRLEPASAPPPSGNR